MTIKSQLNTERRETQYEILITSIDEAASLISPAWPLQTAISVNPFTDATHLPIEQALWEFDRARQGTLFPEHLKVVRSTNAHLIKWIAPYVDQGQSVIGMPDRHLGFYTCWKGLAPHDKALASFNAIPDEPREAILRALEFYEIKQKDWTGFLQFHLVQLPGWSGCAKWHGLQNESGLNLVEFLAVRLTIATLLTSEEFSNEWKRSSSPLLGEIEKAEAPFRKTLEQQLSSIQSAMQTDEKATFQWVFCIDVRSEPMRRKIEALPSHETFGFAGFFNVPIQLRSPCGDETCHSAPVILDSEHEVAMQLGSDDSQKVAKRVSFFKASRKLYKTVKSSFLAPFVLAEAMGPFAGAAMCLQTLKPGALKKMSGRLKGDTSSIPVLDTSDIDFETRITWARGALMGMGLTRHFAEAVMICGHAATTTNNPHQSALQCGACGGNPGGANAQVLCATLNDPAIRTELVKFEIHIPESTWFIPAEHNTTTDTINLLTPTPQSFLQSQLLEQIRELCDKNPRRICERSCPVNKPGLFMPTLR